jgi:hypothetical protein
MNFKEKLENITEHEYRELDFASYSLLKAIETEGPLALKDPTFKTGAALDFGQLVDTLITRPESLHEVFHTKAIEKPTASLLALGDSIILDAIVNDDPYEEAVKEKNIELRIAELGLWSNIVDPEKRRAKYDSELFYTYIKESLDARGKIIVSQDVLDAANHCADVLLHHEFTRDLFQEREGVEVLKQAKIVFKFHGTTLKAMLDLLIVDHNNKTISPFDIKTGVELPTEFDIAYHKYRYYLQATLYLLAVQSLNLEENYTILPFKFIYISKKLPDVPVIYSVPESLLAEYTYGWRTDAGYRRKGLLELIEDYRFYKENDTYNVERVVVSKKGNFTIESI